MEKVTTNLYFTIINYRVFLKFSYTWNELFVVNWFISNFFWGNTKWKKVSSPHYLKILMKLSKHGISYSLKRDPRSISKITFYANLRVSPIDTELWFFNPSQQYLGLNEFSWMAMLNSFFLILQVLWRNLSSISIELTLKLAQNVILEIDLGLRLRL